jgi:CRP/FNR family cyclic AMP-dependent transcriptional regulator
LPGAGHDTIHSLVASADVRRLRAEDVIFRQGEPARLSLIIRGHAAFRRTTVDGQQVVVGIAVPGDLYGITSMSAAVSSVDYVALTDCETAVWMGPEVRQFVALDPDFALDMLDRLASFLNILTEKVDGFLHQDARRRVVRILARHGDLFFADPPIVSRAILPGLVGTSREMTGRVLRELEREGTVVRVGRTGLRLLRADRLDPEATRQSRDAS